MKIIAFIASLVVALLIPIGAVFAVLAVQPRPAGIGAGVLLAAVTVLCMTPVFAGIQVANWIADPATPDGRRYFLRLVLIIASIQLLAAIAIVAASIMEGWPLWLPVASIAVGAGLCFASVTIGERLRRADAQKPRPAADESAATDAALTSALTIKRKARTIMVTFFIALFGAAVLIGGLEVVLPHKHPLSAAGILPAVLEVVAFGLLITSFACVLSVRPIAMQMKQTFDGDVRNQRTIARVVMKGKQDQLTEAQRPLAARYAALAAVYYPFVIAQALLLYLGVLFMQANELVTGFDDRNAIFHFGLGCVVLVAGIVLIPVLIRQRGHAKRYANEHRADAAVPGVHTLTPQTGLPAH